MSTEGKTINYDRAIKKVSQLQIICKEEPEGFRSADINKVIKHYGNGDCDFGINSDMHRVFGEGQEVPDTFEQFLEYSHAGELLGDFDLAVKQQREHFLALCREAYDLMDD